MEIVSSLRARSPDFVGTGFAMTEEIKEERKTSWVEGVPRERFWYYPRTLLM